MIDEIVSLYLNHEDWHRWKLSEQQARRYFEVAFLKDALITSKDPNGHVAGYIETWRVNYDQLGRIVCDEPFHIEHEDIQTGNIAYIAGLTIRPELRSSCTMLDLKHRFFMANFMCEYFIGEKRNKRHAPLKVFTRTQFIEKYISDSKVAFDGKREN
mgnify:FL=1